MEWNLPWLQFAELWARREANQCYSLYYGQRFVRNINAIYECCRVIAFCFSFSFLFDFWMHFSSASATKKIPEERICADQNMSVHGSRLHHSCDTSAIFFSDSINCMQPTHHIWLCTLGDIRILFYHTFHYYYNFFSCWNFFHRV